MQNPVPAFLSGSDPVKTIFAGTSKDQRHPGERDPEPVSAAEFVEAMRSAVTGVSIVTTDGAAGLWRNRERLCFGLCGSADGAGVHQPEQPGIRCAMP